MIVPAEAPVRALTLVTGATGFTGGIWSGRWSRTAYPCGSSPGRRSGPADAARRRRDPRGRHRRPDVIERAMQGVGTVYHLAAVYREAKHPALRYREVNVEASPDAARGGGPGVRTTLCALQHGGGPRAHRLTPGGRERRVRTGGRLSGHEVRGRAAGAVLPRPIPLAVARPTAIYGPGDTRLLKMFRLITQQRFPLLGGGENYYHTVHVKDLVRGLRLLGTHSRAVGEVFILGGRVLPEAVRARGHDRGRGGGAGPVAEAAGPPVPARRVAGGEALCPARHRAAAVPPPGGLLHQEPGRSASRRPAVSLGYRPR